MFLKAELFSHFVTYKRFKSRLQPVLHHSGFLGNLSFASVCLFLFLALAQKDTKQVCDMKSTATRGYHFKLKNVDNSAKPEA